MRIASFVQPIRYKVPDKIECPETSQIAKYCASNIDTFRVCKFPNDFMGRRAIACRKIAAGTPIVTESSYLWLPAIEQEAHMCHSCGRVLSQDEVANLSPESGLGYWTVCSEACTQRTSSLQKVFESLTERVNALCSQEDLEVNLGRLILKFVLLSAMESDTKREEILPVIPFNSRPTSNVSSITNSTCVKKDTDEKTTSGCVGEVCSTKIHRVPLDYIFDLTSHPRLLTQNGKPVESTDREALSCVEAFAKGLYEMLPASVRNSLARGGAECSSVAPKDFIQLVVRIIGILNANCHGLVVPTESLQQGTRKFAEYVKKGFEKKTKTDSSEKRNDRIVLEILSKIDAGVFGGAELGSGVFPICAQFNHSCDPNATFMTLNHSGKSENFGATIQVRSLRDIDEGEEIFVNYVPLDRSKGNRRLNLVVTKGFVCSCSRCLGWCQVTDTKRPTDEAGELLTRYSNDSFLGAVRSKQLTPEQGKHFMVHDKLDVWKTGSESICDFWIEAPDECPASIMNRSSDLLEQVLPNPLPMLLRRTTNPSAFMAAQGNRLAVVFQQESKDGLYQIESKSTVLQTIRPVENEITEMIEGTEAKAHEFMSFLSQRGEFAARGEKGMQVYYKLLNVKLSALRKDVEATAEYAYRSLSLSHEKFFEIIPMLLLVYTQSLDSAIRENNSSEISMYNQLLMRWSQTQLHILKKFVHSSYPGLQNARLHVIIAIANAEVGLQENIEKSKDKEVVKRQTIIISAYSSKRLELLKEYCANIVNAYGADSEYASQLKACGIWAC